jgi:CubicO group peptidase (beta-lactamase class C family)
MPDNNSTGYIDHHLPEKSSKIATLAGLLQILMPHWIARHVLSHTSGFQNWRAKEEPLKIHFTPGEKFPYSGEGYSYLQSVVTHPTGEPIQTYMKENLFVPFGMDSSGYVWNGVFEKRMARPHDS